MYKLVSKIFSNIAWFYRECTGKCQECKKSYMTTENEANGDAELLGLPMWAHCKICGAKRLV